MIAVLFGPPGSGKGTQSWFICKTFSLAHVSTGEMLRAEVEKGSVLGREVEPIMDAGDLVPDDLVVRVLEERLRHDDARTGVLLDGFPRTVPQAQALDAMLRRSRRKVDLVLFLDAPEDVLVDRVLRRSADEGRTDDTPDVLRNRLQVYATETEPVLQYYESTGTRIRRVDGVGSIEDVQQRIRNAFLDGSGGVAA
jgi:adenylate kinase